MSEKQPSIYYEHENVRNLSDLPTHALDQKQTYYGELQLTGVTERTRKMAARIFEHVTFELDWRDGKYKQPVEARQSASEALSGVEPTN